MPAHQIDKELFRAEPFTDPGASGTITADRSPLTCLLVTAAAESRTLARPTRAGGRVTLVLKTDGGDLTLTVTGGYDVVGNTSLVFTDAGQFATFVAGYDGTNYYWRLEACSPDMLDRAAAETVAAANTLTAAESGKTFFLNAATEFATTLPAPQAGLRFNFIVTGAPTGASYTIVTSGSSNIIKGQVYTTDVNSATDPDFETSGGDTITLVDAKAVAGDRVELFCDGTNWFAYCFCSVFDAITITGS